MALSILPLGPRRKTFGIWDSETSSFIHKGSMSEMEDKKDCIERHQQAEADEQWMKEVREKRIAELSADGYTPAEAEAIIKKNIPGLWKENS